ncbi:unnamed protein product [Dovyalis caffra]|uniref:NB-ARC domain-containing protein n=1 Tax=Dovyalis caffra TaxID=77055 RepID=A0AAV1S385_9ROSI|nr:unnamed protein product [Dovyalis caffra]
MVVLNFSLNKEDEGFSSVWGAVAVIFVKEVTGNCIAVLLIGAILTDQWKWEIVIGPVWDMIKLMWAPVGRRIQLARRLGWIDDVEKIEQRRTKCIEEVDVRIGELKEMSKFEGGIVLDLHRHLLLSFCSCRGQMEPAPINRTLQKVLAHIRSEKIHQIGIWGMGGVGKTTVVKALNNLPEISITFEIVIWVTVSSQGSIDKIQKDVARRLSSDVNDADPIHTVANKIYQILSSNKFLLLLDDVWRSLDLGDIGIPNLNEQEKDEEIEVDELIEYWRAEGLTGDAKSIIDGYNKGRDLFNTLVQKSLLEMVGYSRCRMHDLLRDLALIITSPRGNNDSKFLVRAGLRDGSHGNEEEWKQMKRISFMKSTLGTLPESPDCPILSTLFLQYSLPLQTIPNKFFQHLVELQVLDLSYTRIRSLPSSISKLPSEVGSLKKLQELQMAEVAVQSLPFEIMNLNLDIPAGVIKSLISLELLQIGVKLLQSAHVAMLDEVACLRNLTKIHLSFPNVENLERFLSTSWSWKEQRFLNFRFFVNNNWDPSVYPQPELSHGALILYDCQDSPTTPIPPTITESLRICSVLSCNDIEILANGDESEGGEIFADLENLELSLFAEIESNTGRATVNKKLLKSQLFEIGQHQLSKLESLSISYCDRLEDIFEENEFEPEMIRSDGHQLPRLKILRLQWSPQTRQY